MKTNNNDQVRAAGPVTGSPQRTDSMPMTMKTNNNDQYWTSSQRIDQFITNTFFSLGAASENLNADDRCIYIL